MITLKPIMSSLVNTPIQRQKPSFEANIPFKSNENNDVVDISYSPEPKRNEDDIEYTSFSDLIGEMKEENPDMEDSTEYGSISDLFTEKESTEEDNKLMSFDELLQEMGKKDPDRTENK